MRRRDAPGFRIEPATTFADTTARLLLPENTKTVKVLPGVLRRIITCYDGCRLIVSVSGDGLELSLAAAKTISAVLSKPPKPSTPPLSSTTT